MKLTTLSNKLKAFTPQALTLMLSALSSLALAGETIHPLCFEPFTDLKKSGGKSPVVNLASCQQEYIKYPFDQVTPWQSLFNKRKPGESNKAIDLPERAEYQIIGQMQDQQTLVSYKVNYGGSGTFTHAFLVKGISLSPKKAHDKQLEKVLDIEGGDRCFGSIEQLSIISPDHFEIRRNITPSALISYGSDASASIKITKGLSDCALCCIGHFTERVNLKGEKELTGVTLLPRELRTTDTPQERCLNRLTKADTHTIQLSKEALKELQSNYVSQCIEEG